MAEEEDEFALRLGRAAIDAWGDVPRDLQEALFETAVRGRDDLRPALARLLHDRHPRTEYSRSPPD